MAKDGPSYYIMEEKQETAEVIFEKDQIEEIRARYDIMLKYFHQMTTKLQELKQENNDLKEELKKSSKTQTWGK